VSQLQRLLENRRVYNLDSCELILFESFETAHKLPLAFNDVVFTSMLTGKKVMYMDGTPEFEYLPGESLVIPPRQGFHVTFPEAQMDNPTRCVAFSIDANFIHKTVQFLNEFYNENLDELGEWSYRFNRNHFRNSADMAALVNKLIQICSGGEASKNIFADLTMKELLIRLIQNEQLETIKLESKASGNCSRKHYVLNYIAENLTEKIAVDELSKRAYLSRNSFFKWFRQQFGTSPLEYITAERIKLAKKLLTDTNHTVSEVSHECGFTDVNYFIRVFRKSEGITPGAYQARVIQKRLR